jgi:putative protein-disulfide isomerase
MTGGLRAYNQEPLDEALRANLLDNWKRVAEVSGLPFAPGFTPAPGFVFDTEAACRAVVTARAVAPDAAFSVFHAIQHAFFAEGRDVTQPDVLAEIAAAELAAAGHPLAAAAFHERWSGNDMILEAAQDFGQTRRWGVTGFPTLVLERAGQLDLVTSGYMKVEQLVERMQSIVDGDAVPA